MACADVYSLTIVQNTHRGQRVVVVGKRFAHAHEHDIRYALQFAFCALTSGNFSFVFSTGSPLHRDYLGHDLSNRQVSPESLLARGAKRAAQRAAGLGRYTRGFAIAAVPVRLIAHEHGFYQFAIVQTEKRFASRAVCGSE